MKGAQPDDARTAEVLARVGVRRTRIALPVPVPPANVYLAGEGDLLMVDCGPLWDEGWSDVAAGLRAGERVTDLLVTHGHVDHHGAAARAARELQCKIWCHPFDLPAVRDFEEVLSDRFDKWSSLARESGMPEKIIARMAGHYMFMTALGESAPHVEPLEGGASVRVGGYELEAIHAPGHTAGSLVFLERKRRLLFSGDTVLPGITPNPFFEGITDAPSGPAVFLDSIQRLRGLPVDVVLPGHGPPVTDLKGRLDDYEAHHRQRRAAIVEALRRKRAASAFEVVEALFPGVSPLDAWLALAEVAGHLQQLERMGEVERGPMRGKVVLWNARA